MPEGYALADPVPVFIDGPGDDETLEIPNPRLPKLRLIKEIVPDSDGGTFDLSVDSTVKVDEAGDGEGSDYWFYSTTGSHTVSEAGGSSNGGTSLADYTSQVVCNKDKGSNLSGTSLTFDLDWGDEVTCTFTNTRKGQIIIEKQTLPDGDLASFSFSGNVSGSLTDGQTADAVVVPGSYSSTETVPTGWKLTDITCDDGNSSGDTGTGVATFNVEPGETVKCTFTNTKDGKIIIEKQTLPDGDLASFSFSGDVSGSLTDGQTADAVVIPGTHSSTETVTSGWKLTDITCDDGNSSGDTGTGVATFNVEPGETVKCTFTNTKDGKIIIEKQTLPDGDLASFSFSGDVSGSLTDGQTADADVIPGPYSSTETVPTGWKLTDITCDDGNSSGDIGTGVATFNVEPGETVKCTFTNTKAATIIVKKLAYLYDPTPVDPTTGQPVDADTFDFTGEITATLSHNETSSTTVDPGGPYYVAESVNADWGLTDISCDDADSTGNIDTRTATFDKLDPGQTVTCTFTNRPLTDITVNSQSQVPGGTNSTITCRLLDDTVLDEQEGEDALVSLTDLLPNTYVCTVVVEDGS